VRLGCQPQLTDHAKHNGADESCSPGGHRVPHGHPQVLIGCRLLDVVNDEDVGLILLRLKFEPKLFLHGGKE
jgi:hypothetical protein